MRAWSLSVQLKDQPGELARVASAFGEAGINLEGFSCVTVANHPHAQFLVSDEKRARGVIEKTGYTVDAATEVIVEVLPNRPGALGEVARQFASEGVNLTTAYLATDTRMVWGAKDITALERVHGKLAAGAR